MVRGLRIPALALAALLGASAGAGAWVHTLVPGQKAFGVIGAPAEEDEVRFAALQGTTLSFTLKARKGEALLPVFTKLLDPGSGDVLSGDAVKVRTNGKGTVTKLTLRVPGTGTWVLGISGSAGSTGTWDLVSTGRGKVPLGAASIAVPGAEVGHAFDADAGTEATVQVKASAGSTLHPLVARIEMPEGVGDYDLAGAKRRTTPRADTLSRFPLANTGTWTVVVTGADGTTGAYDAVLRVGRKVPVDMTATPDGGPPPQPPPTIDSVSTPTVAIPGSGTESRSLTVNGSGFQVGSSVVISPGPGTSGVSNVEATRLSGSELSVTFDLASTATPGARDVTVDNPDLQTVTMTGALTLQAPPTITVVSVTPNHGSGAGGTQVLVQGTGFSPGASVSFGGLPARAVIVVDSRNVLCAAPAAASVSPTAGTAVGVTVDNGGGDAATLAGGFTYDADSVPPTVASTLPAPNATGVARNQRAFVFVMSEPVAASSVSSTAGFDFFGTPVNDMGAPPVSSVGLGPANRFVVLSRGPTPANLTGGNGYRANMPVTVADPAGNPLDPVPFGGSVYQIKYTAHPTSVDGTAPTVSGTVPAGGATNAAVDAPVTVAFGEPVDPTTVAAAVSLRRGATPVSADLDLDAACTTATLTPRTRLAASTSYSVSVTTALKDLAGNSLASAFANAFVTAAADGVAPTQVLTVDGLAQDLNGSGTYVPGTSNAGASTAPGAATPFNIHLPLSGFPVDLVFADSGGSGVDTSSFTFTCSVAMGGVGPGQDLSGQFAVTPLGARWTVDAGHAPAAGTNVTFTANVSDYAGNPATARTLAVDASDITRTIANAAGTPSTDRDPFNSRQSWLLRFDQDIWTTVLSAGGTGSHPNPLTVATSLASNGIPDFGEDLQLVGLNGPQAGAGASTVTNGADTGTNAIVQTMVRNSVRGYMNMRYGIGYDGTRSADSAAIEFLLQGETKTGGGTVTPAGWTPSSGFSMMTFTGDEQANASGSAIGRANLDFRNRVQDNDSNTGAADGTNLGTFATHMVRVRINDPKNTQFPLTFDPLVATGGRGGTPVGSSADDAVVLDDSFVYASANPARKSRYDLIAKAVDRYALYLAAAGAHEVGHSTGLVPDGPPPTGLFGNAHPNNTFIASATFTTANHVDTVGPNLMEAGISFDDSIAQGSAFMTFEPMSLAYLLRRMIYDQ